MAFDVVSAAYASMFPADSASQTATCETVPKFAVAVGNSTAAAVVAVLPETVKVTVWRTYAVPEVETSVPDASSSGLAVCSARYNVLGAVYALPPKT